MMEDSIAQLVVWSGIAQLAILVASLQIPFRLNWKEELRSLSRLHRQLYWVYGGYVVLSIIAFAIIAIIHAHEIAVGSGLARAFCGYVAVFWGIRLGLQAVLEVQVHLSTRWLKLGYHTLTAFFVALTAFYGWLALC